MKKGLVIGGGAVGALIAVAGVVFVFVLSNLDSLIKEAVERVGSDSTQAKVTLNKVEISLKSGSGALTGLKVGNPKGFQTPSAFELGGIAVTLDTRTVGDDTVVIKEIVIDGPKVTYEMADAGSNIDAIKKNVDAYKQHYAGRGGQRRSGEGPKLVIENLYIKRGEINVSAGFLKGKSLSTPLPDIHLKDIGKEKKGATPSEIATLVIDSMTSGVGKAVGALDLDKMMGEATKALREGAGEAAKAATEGAAEAAKGAVEGVGKALGEGAGQAGEGLKKLFGK
jgi:hypothetical protein